MLEKLENTKGAKWTIQRNWQPRVDKTRTEKIKKNNTICAGHHYAQRNTNNVNRT